MGPPQKTSNLTSQPLGLPGASAIRRRGSEIPPASEPHVVPPKVHPSPWDPGVILREFLGRNSQEFFLLEMKALRWFIFF